MPPFAIAGVQMHVAALNDTVEAMRHRLDVLMARFPWTQMVLFSELAPYGPLPRFPVAAPHAAPRAEGEVHRRLPQAAALLDRLRRGLRHPLHCGLRAPRADHEPVLAGNDL